MIIRRKHVFPTATECHFCSSLCVFVACRAQNVTNSTHSCNWYPNKSFSSIPFTTFCWEAFHSGSARDARPDELQSPWQEVMSWHSRMDAPFVAAGALGPTHLGLDVHQPIGGVVSVGRLDQWNAQLRHYLRLDLKCVRTSNLKSIFLNCCCQTEDANHMRAVALTPTGSQAAFCPQRRFTHDLTSP